MSRPRRIVIGTASTAEPALDALTRAARRSRDRGAEVIWIGGGAGPEVLAAVAVAEDADEVLLGRDDDLAAVRSALSDLGADDLEVAAAPAT